MNDFSHIGRDVDDLLRSFLLVERKGFHRGQINDAAESVFGSDRQREEGDLSAEAIPNACDRLFKVRPFTVHPAHKQQTGKMEFIGILPDLFRLELDAGDGIDKNHRPIHNSETTLRIKGKIGITRGVDDIDAVFVPIDVACGCTDGDVSLLLFRFVVQGGSSVVHAPRAVRLARQVEKRFAQGGFSRSPVSDDSQISYRFCFIF